MLNIYHVNFFKGMCNKERCRRSFVKPKDLNTTTNTYCDVECCFGDDCNDNAASSTKSIADWLSSSNDMTMKTIAPRSSLSGARSTKSIADWLSRSFVYMMVFAVWSSIAQ